MAKILRVLPEKNTLYQSVTASNRARYPAFSIRAEAHNLLFVFCLVSSEALDLLEYRIKFLVVILINENPFFLCENISMFANILVLT